MSKSVTLIFPGQGAQYVGMGEKLKDHKSFDLITQTKDILEYDLPKMMMEGPEESLTLTENTQPAIVAYSVALYEKLAEILNEKKIKVDQVLGHSVGEYSALVAAGAISFENAIKSVHLRGKYMQEAVPVGTGTMYAILKVPAEIVEKACMEASTDSEKVMPANFNEPNQIVISGNKNACERAVAWLKSNVESAHKTVELKVSAPFHSSLMEPAAEKLKAFLDGIDFNSPKTPYIANIDAKKYDTHTNGDLIKENLFRQVAGSVRWEQSFASLPDDTICIEVGPGRVLMGLARKINRNIKVISLDKEGAFDDVLEALQ